jgi:hypothetical protein
VAGAPVHRPDGSAFFVGVDARAQRIHEVHDIGWTLRTWRFDFLAVLLPLQKLLERVFVVILKFLRLKFAAL